MEVDDDDNGALSPSMLAPLRMCKPDHNDYHSSSQLALVKPASRFTLPDNWRVRKVPRRTTRRCFETRIDKYYHEPGTGLGFRSLREVERYLTGETYSPRPRGMKLWNDVKSSRLWKISGGKMLRLDEKKSSQHQLAFLDPTIAAATPPFKLPDGWIVKAVPRRCSTTQSRNKHSDKYYYEPGTGRMFRSLISVEKYLEKMKEDVPLSEAFQLGNIVKKKNSSKRKARTWTSDLMNPPQKVNWVLAGPGGDTWSPFIGESAVPDCVKQQWAQRFMVSISNEHYYAP